MKMEDYLSSTDKYEKTPLMIACDKAHPQTVRSILSLASEGVNVELHKKKLEGSCQPFIMLPFQKGQFKPKRKSFHIFGPLPNN